MSMWKRREFLGASLTGLSAGLFAQNRFALAKSSSESASHDGKKVEGPETLFLTWQRDPCTTMTVQWIAAENDWKREVAASQLDQCEWVSYPVSVKDFPNTDLKVFRAEMTNLQPGKEYCFRVGGKETLFRFRTMPTKATNVIQFVSGGDCGVNDAAIATNLMAARQDPYFALIGGDLAYDNGRSPETFWKFLRNYRAQMIDSEGRLIPMISCLGNHEVNGSYDQPRSASPAYLSVFDGLFSELTYGVLDIGDYMSLVLLDTGHLSPIAGEQTSWLEKTLADRQERPHLIVANHVPAYPSYRVAAIGDESKSGTGGAQRKHWCPLFEKYKVDVVLEHHDHTFKRTHPLTNGLYDKNGVIYLGDGSWGRLRALQEPSMRPYLAAVNSQFHMTVHRLEGGDRFHVALEADGRLADVCHTSQKRLSR